MVLDSALEVSFLGVLGGMVICAILVSGYATFLGVRGSTLPSNVCDACCRILVITVFAVSANDCGDILLLLSCASSLQIVSAIFATF